jgi:hypothetical protein
VRAGEFGHDEPAAALGANHAAEYRIRDPNHWRKHGCGLDLCGADLKPARKHDSPILPAGGYPRYKMIGSGGFCSPLPGR